MAETLKLGAGIWGTKEDSLLAYNSENGNYKPLPFDFTRASSATVVNKAGLIETVGSGTPRIDFLGNTNGALKLEPQRTNLITQSNQFNTSWAALGATLQDNQSGVSGGLNAWKMTEDTSTAQHFVQLAGSLTAAAEQTVTIYAKAAERNYLMLNQSGVFRTYYDLVNGTVVSSGTGVTASMESMPNGWWRCVYTATMTYTSLRVCVNNDGSSNSYTGDGVSGIYIQYCQNESLSYPTSYIPTQGSTVTRVADACSQTPPSGIIGQTEGSIFTEFKSLDSVANLILWMRNPSGGNYGDMISLACGADNRFRFEVRASNVASCTFVSDVLPTNIYYKVAVAYKQNDFVMYLNGVQIGTDDTGNVPTCSEMYVGKYIDGGIRMGVVKDLKLYNTRLSNSELATLTTL
jgi:hypothetical protein